MSLKVLAGHAGWIRGYWFAGFSILLATMAQLMMKLGVSQLPDLAVHWRELEFWLAAKADLMLVIVGLGAYFLSMLSWLMALSILPLNKAYPLISISYALVYLASVSLPWFHEAFAFSKFAGVLLICVGVILVVSRPRERQPNEE